MGGIPEISAQTKCQSILNKLPEGWSVPVIFRVLTCCTVCNPWVFRNKRAVATNKVLEHHAELKDPTVNVCILQY